MKKIIMSSLLIASLLPNIIEAREVSVEQRITGLYVAYFDRAGDQEGVNFWKGEASASSGNVLSVLNRISAQFANNIVFTSSYSHLSNRAFVEAIYQNALGRSGDSEGIDFWTGRLNSGMTRSDMVAKFIDTSLTIDMTIENFPNLSSADLSAGQLRQDLIANQVAVASRFTEVMGNRSNLSTHGDPTSDPAYKASVCILDTITASSSSVSSVMSFLNTATIATINARCGEEPEPENRAPVISNSNISVDENQKTALTILATDADDDTLTYSLAGDDVASFDIDTSTGVVTFKTEPDYETKNIYNITLSASDEEETTTKNVSIAINDLNGESYVLQTGQVDSYSLKDDGDYKAGKDRSFTKTGDIVTDNARGLIWRDDDTPDKKNYADAVSYCSGLNPAMQLIGNQPWRLPTINELNSILNYGTHDPSIFDTFENVDTHSYYWSSTEYKRLAGNNHHTLTFNYGYSKYSSDDIEQNVRCVKNKFLIASLIGYSRFTKTSQVITDNTTKLQWHDKTILIPHGTLPNITFTEEGSPTPTGTFSEAISACENLVVAGKNDWRLANINELRSIIDYTKTSGSIFYDEFKSNTTGSYLSSTTSALDDAKLRSIGSDTTIYTSATKASTLRYRCVRTMGD